MPTRVEDCKDMVQIRLQNLKYQEYDPTAIIGKTTNDLLSLKQTFHPLTGQPLNDNQTKGTQYVHSVGIVSIGNLKFSIAEEYEFVAKNEFELPKMDSINVILSTDHLEFRLETIIIPTRMSSMVAKMESNELVDTTHIQYSTQRRVHAKLPELEISVDHSILCIFLRLYNIWVELYPDLDHPFLSAASQSPANLFNDLKQDKIFNQFRFSDSLYKLFKEFRSSVVELIFPFVKFSYKHPQLVSLSFFIDSMSILQEQGFLSSMTSIKIANILVQEESKSRTWAKLLKSSEQEKFGTSDERSGINILMTSRHPDLLGSLTRNFKNKENSQEENHTQFETTISLHSRLYLEMDPPKLQELSKAYLAGKIESGLKNKSIVEAQVRTGSRMRLLKFAPGLNEVLDSGIQDLLATLAQDSVPVDSLRSRTDIILENGILVNLLLNEVMLYSLIGKKVKVKMMTFEDMEMHCKVKLQGLKLVDMTDLGEVHRIILASRSEKNYSLEVVFNSFSTRKASQKRYNNYLGVLLEGVNFCFLKRRTNELVEYFKNHLLFYLLYSRGYEILDQSYYETLSKFSTTKMEVLLQNALVQIPKNSISLQGLKLEVSKIGFYNIGIWGNQAGELIISGYFQSEQLYKSKLYEFGTEEEQKEIQNLREYLTRITKGRPNEGSGSKRRGSASYNMIKDAYVVLLTKLKVWFTEDVSTVRHSSQSGDSNEHCIESEAFNHVEIEFDGFNMMNPQQPRISISGKPFLLQSASRSISSCSSCTRTTLPFSTMSFWRTSGRLPSCVETIPPRTTLPRLYGHL